MNFYQLPVVESTAIDSSVNGVPFTNDAVRVANGIYAGTDNGTVYLSRVGDKIYFVCVSSGYTGYLYIVGTPSTTSYELSSTSYSSISDSQTITVPSGYTWYIDLTNFTDESAMLEMFYNTYVSTDPDVQDGIVVRVTAVPSDPQDEGGTSDEGGGDGEYDDSSDPMPIPNIPTLSGTNTGLVTLFRPSKAELQALGKYLWTNVTDFIENLQKVFSNPMDYFIAFHIVPAYPDVDTSRNIKLGVWETNVSMPPVKSQWYEMDFGTVALSPYWNSALDYAPYTKISLFLPFIGSVSLNTDEIMGNIIGLTYRIDLLSGQCLAIVSVNGDAYYQFTGECAVSVPLTGADWSRIYSAAIGSIGATVAGVAGVATAATAAGGTAAYTHAANAASKAVQAMKEVPKGMRGAPAVRASLVEIAQRSVENANNVANNSIARGASLATSRIANTVTNVAGNIMGAKPIIQHSGSISGSVGMMGIRTPYFLVEYPNQSLAENYKHYVGYPSNMYSSLSSLSGYTECEQVIVSGINATDDEISEITEALKGGVYL